MRMYEGDKHWHEDRFNVLALELFTFSNYVRDFTFFLNSLLDRFSTFTLKFLLLLLILINNSSKISNITTSSSQLQNVNAINEICLVRCDRYSSQLRLRRTQTNDFSRHSLKLVGCSTARRLKTAYAHAAKIWLLILLIFSRTLVHRRQLIS